MAIPMLPGQFCFSIGFDISEVEIMMVEFAAIQVDGAIGYSPPRVMHSTFANGTRPPELPDDPAGLLEEASELLYAAKVFQMKDPNLPGKLNISDVYDAAAQSLVEQKLRLQPVLECDLFEPIYEQLHMACQAAEMVSNLKPYGLDRVLDVWIESFPQTDYWKALVWVSREWKRRSQQKNSEPPFGLRIDGETISRAGNSYRDSKIDWRNHSEKLAAVSKMLESHPEPVPSDDIGGSLTSRSTLKNRMNEDLEKIDLRIEKRKWLLCSVFPDLDRKL